MNKEKIIKKLKNVEWDVILGEILIAFMIGFIIFMLYLQYIINNQHYELMWWK